MDYLKLEWLVGLQLTWKKKKKKKNYKNIKENNVH